MPSTPAPGAVNVRAAAAPTGKYATSTRITSVPTSATRAATAAVASPPVHSRVASRTRPVDRRSAAGRVGRGSSMVSAPAVSYEVGVKGVEGTDGADIVVISLSRSGVSGSCPTPVTMLPARAPHSRSTGLRAGRPGCPPIGGPLLHRLDGRVAAPAAVLALLAAAPGRSRR